MIDIDFQNTGTVKNAVVSIISEKEIPTLTTILSKDKFNVHELDEVPIVLDSWEITPDVIILDVIHQNIWHQQLEVLQEMEVFKNIPVLVWYDEVNKEKAFSAAEKGVFSYISSKDLCCVIPIIIAAVNHWRRFKEVMVKSNELNRMLSTNYLVLDSKNKYLNIIKKKIDLLDEQQISIIKKELTLLSRNINDNIKKEYHYELFKAHFEEVHPLFYKKLLSINSDLSNNDLKLAAFIKIGFNNDEISLFLGISIAGVKKAIQRMKKRLKLLPEASLRKFILTIEFNE